MSATLVWFRRDLRLADNPALREGLRHGESIIPVFIDDRDDALAWSPGSASNWWLHHSLQALGAKLENLGSRLIIRAGAAQSTLEQLAAETRASRILWNRIYDPGSVARDASLKSALRQQGLDVQSFNSALLHEPWDILNLKREPYKVFTPFYRAALARGMAAPLDEPNEPLPPVPAALPSLDLSALRLLPRIRWDQGLGEAWTPGEDAANQALQDFARGALENYAEDRDRPDRVGTSRLSPFLHFGEIGPRQVAAAILTIGEQRTIAGQPRHVDTFLRELIWREFSHHLLFHFPDTADFPMDQRFASFPWADEREAALASWQRGNTGIPLVDAGMRELWHTGWMHNRVRMAVASFLTKNLRIHWLSGARWFWDTLVDADLANNTLGWQWCAGCGADAAPYFRIFNPVLQGQKFDPDGAYIRRWLPELAGLNARDIHRPWQVDRGALAAAGVHLGQTYPLPVVDLRLSREAALTAFASIKAAGNLKKSGESEA